MAFFSAPANISFNAPALRRCAGTLFSLHFGRDKDYFAIITLIGIAQQTFLVPKSHAHQDYGEETKGFEMHPPGTAVQYEAVCMLESNLEQGYL